MNNQLKIIILAVSIIAAIGAVMVFAKSQVEPPVVQANVDPYADDVTENVNSMFMASSRAQEDSILISTLDKISFYSHENKVKPADADKKIDALLGDYSTKFLKSAYGKFASAKWSDGDIQYIQRQSSLLKSVHHSDKSLALRKTARDSLAQIEGIIGRYHQAQALAHKTGFAGTSAARSVIQQANGFMGDKYLSRNAGLMSSLKGLKANIGRSHFSHVSAQVEKLANYRHVSQEYYFNTLVPQVDAAINEYKNNASSLYGSSQSIDGLMSRAYGYIDQASNYYDD